MNSWTTLIAAHAAGATVAVALGGFNVVRARKGDLLHRRVGRVWFVSMYWVAFSSFGIRRLNPGHFSWIHGLSAWTIVSLTMALWAAMRGNIPAHRGWVIGSYCGLVGAGIAAMAFPSRLVPQTTLHHPLTMLAALVALTAVSAGLILALARPSRGDGPADLGRVGEEVVGVAGR